MMLLYKTNLDSLEKNISAARLLNQIDLAGKIENVSVRFGLVRIVVSVQTKMLLDSCPRRVAIEIPLRTMISHTNLREPRTGFSTVAFLTSSITSAVFSDLVPPEWLVPHEFVELEVNEHLRALFAQLLTFDSHSRTFPASTFEAASLDARVRFSA
jgi:hypothetical protein